MPISDSDLKIFVQDVKDVAAKLKKSPLKLTHSDYAAHSTLQLDVVERELGPPVAVIRKLFSDPFKNLAARAEANHRARYVKNLEKRVGEKEYIANTIAETLRETIIANPIPIASKTITKQKPLKKERANVAFISDTHFGLDIDPDEVPTNQYNWTVAARRMGKYAQQVAEYKAEHRAECPTLYVCLGGDLAQGVMHLNDHGVQLLTHQLYGAQWILTQMIEYWRKFYKQIVVECVPDNHLRLAHKGPGRSTAQKYDSHATSLHLGLLTAFRTAKDVKFNIPKTPYAEFDVLRHRFWMSHGDTVLQSGRVSNSINIGRITSRVQALQASHAKKIDVVMLGHVHVPVSTTLDDGTELLVNGTGSGIDSYAQSLGIQNNHPCQLLFESTSDYPVGDLRKIFLRDADNDARYESVVKPYDGSFTQV